MTEAASSPPADAAVRVESVSKQFGKGGVLALDDIDLVVERGEFVSLLGPSGCGKSTLLRLVADLDTPTSGRLTVNGKTPHQARLDRDYGMVFQQAGLFEWRTAVRNVQLPLRLMGFSPEQRKARAMETLELVQLTEFADHYPWQLSGGMQQRVSIARALAFRPQLLLMDEPLGALDEMTREYLQTELIRLWSTTGLTVLFVTHSVTEAVFLSTKIAVMSPRPGRLVELIEVGLPRERTAETRSTPEYFSEVARARAVLHGVHGDEVSRDVDDAVRRIVVPACFAVVIIGAWEVIVRVFDVDPFVLPRPSAIGSTFLDEWPAIRSALHQTVTEVLLGLLIGVSFGAVMASIVTRFVDLRGPVLAIAVIVNSAPIVALAPIANNLFGVTSIWSKVTICALMAFFPIFVNTSRGLQSTPAIQRDAMRSWAARPREMTRLVQWPNALPHFFSALRLAASLAVIGAIVGEYFGGSTDALGVYIAQAAAITRMDTAWAGIVAASGLGLVLYGAVVMLEKLVMPWHVSVRQVSRA